MNLVAVAPVWLIAVLIVALAAAAIEDFIRLRISDVTSAIVALGAVAAMIAVGPPLSLWQNYAVFAMVLVFGTVAFSRGLMGGGDVKLLAALALWTDLRSGLWLVSAILMSGAVVAVGFLAVAFVHGGGIQAARKRRIPYGVAIAAGAGMMTAVFR
jgi:prepilin peptidase CpaA